MKIFISQFFILVAIAGLGAAITFATVPLERESSCLPETLEPEEVCLETIQNEWTGQNVVWVDARSRKDFEKSAMPNAILLNTDPAEDFDEMLADSVEALAMADRVVVYCGASGCHASKEIVGMLKSTGLVAEPVALFGGVKVLRKAGLM